MHVRLLEHYHVHPTGDYWPGEAENLLGNISEEQRQAGRKGNKGSLTAGGKPRAKSAKVASITSHHFHTVTQSAHFSRLLSCTSATRVTEALSADLYGVLC